MHVQCECRETAPHSLHLSGLNPVLAAQASSLAVPAACAPATGDGAGKGTLYDLFAGKAVADAKGLSIEAMGYAALDRTRKRSAAIPTKYRAGRFPSLASYGANVWPM